MPCWCRRSRLHPRCSLCIAQITFTTRRNALTLIIQVRATIRLTFVPHRSRARTNGATQTFRRPPVAPSLSHTREPSQNLSSNSSTPSSGVYVPPHLNTHHQSSFSRNGPISESRYSKDQLIDLFRAQADPATSSKNLSDLFVGGWNPGDASTTSNGAWSKKDDHKDSAAGPEVCWDHEGKVIPLGMIDITEEEREVFREPHLT